MQFLLKAYSFSKQYYNLNKYLIFLKIKFQNVKYYNTESVKNCISFSVKAYKIYNINVEVNSNILKNIYLCLKI